jgi:shikimate dehydrogenase
MAGVFGYPVRHSASPAMHNAAFGALGLDWAYVPFEVAPEDIGAALAGVRALGMAGVNVTVPLKELVPPHLDGLTDRAAALQAVNTVIHRDGRLIGDSTDGPGFLAALGYAGFTAGPGTRAVVLGAGGSARAVVLALLDAGATVVVANRSEERALALAAQLSAAGASGILTLAPLTEAGVGAALRGAALLVNTTSVGLHPNEDAMPPVPADALTPDLFVIDLIYNPAETKLLALARSRGCRTQNGVEMLVRQGALAFAQWTGVEDPPLDVMRSAVFSVLSMPG